MQFTKHVYFVLPRGLIVPAGRDTDTTNTQGRGTMKARNLRQALGVMLALFFAVCGSYASAAEKAAAKVPAAAAGNIADRWVVWPKAGHEKEFEASVKEFVAWRKKNGDPFSWVAYQPVVGSDLNFYVFRSDDHQWKDLDAEDAWEMKAGANEAYDKMLSMHVEKAAHYFEEIDAAHSHIVGDLKDYKYFSVITRNVKSGSRGEAMAAIDKIHKALSEQKWPHPYRLAWSVGGKDSLRLVFPMKSYADLADPNPSVYQVLEKALGKDDAAATLKQFGTSLEFSDHTIAGVRPDLSTPSK